MEGSEPYLGQILIDGVWTDYARGTEANAKAWVWEKGRHNPPTRRAVDWIFKERILFTNAD
jgi:hypothetical protein